MVMTMTSTHFDVPVERGEPGPHATRRRQGPGVDGVRELIGFLVGTPDAPIESGDMTALFEAVCGSPVTAEISVRAARDVNDRELAILRAGGADRVHTCDGVLRAAVGIPVAEVTALIVTPRVPGPAREALGITRAGGLLPGPCRQPIGRALRGLGVRREQLGVRLTPGRHDALGQAQSLCSVARLWTGSGCPLALVTEYAYAPFLDQFPPPWPWPREATG